MNSPAPRLQRSSFIHHNLSLIIISCLALIVIILSLFYFFISFTRPIMGLVLVLQDDRWQVESVDPNSMSAVAGFLPGDIPIEINGQSADLFLSRYADHGKVIGTLIKEIRVEDQNGLTKQATVIGARPLIRTQIEVSILLVTAILFWAIGLFVFFRQPRKLAAGLLCLVGLCTGLLFSANVAGERLIPAAPQLSVITQILGPWLLLHFFLVLPEERGRLQRDPRLLALYIPPLISIIAFLTIGYADGQPLPWFRQFRMIGTGLVILAVVVTAVYNFVRAASPRTRQQMKYIAYSCVVAFVPFIVIYLIPQITLGQIFVPTGYVMFFLSFIPLGMGYAVITQKLLDIDVIIRRSMVYGLISIIMAVVMAAGVVPVMSFGGGNIWIQIVTALAMGVIAAGVISPLKSFVERLVDRVFYKDRYDYRGIIQSFSLSVNKLQELPDISRLVVGTCVRTLNLAGAALILKGQTKLYDINASEGSFSNPEKKDRLLMQVYQRNPRQEFPLPATSQNPELAFFIPLKTWEKEIGFLCLSPKINRQDFSPDDIFLLQGISSVAASALQSAMLNRDVSLRDTFVSIASHELRTPLTSIIGYADLLLRKETSLETRKTWLKHILDNWQQITAMVDDLLNISRIQSGQVNLRISEVNLTEVVYDRLPLYQESTSKHNFVVNIPDELPPVYADHDKSGQIIGNLLSNAIKYSPNGGDITITAQNEPAEHRVVLSIKDQGLGISPDDEATLFKTFHRVQRPETRAIRGSGLGLYIVKEWIEAMGGKVWLKSQLNEGSTFFISFPTEMKT